MAAAGIAVGWYWVGKFSLSLYWLIKHYFPPCRDSISDAEGSLGCMNLYNQNPKCYNTVNDCSYRVISLFRMAASVSFEVKFSSHRNLYGSTMHVEYEYVCAVILPQKPHP